jgi:hypothetical protein
LAPFQKKICKLICSGELSLTPKSALVIIQLPMKRTKRLFYLQIAAVTAVLSFGVRAFAEPPRDELVHAYWLLKTAKADYHGHRAEALHAVENAGKDLGLELKGGVPERERQWKSDAQLQEAARLLHDARDKMEERDRKRAAEHLEHAIKEVDAALNTR